MTRVKGAVLHCGKYGCIVRLEDGRLANLPAAAASQAGIRRALAAERRPAFSFIVTETENWPVLSVAPDGSTADAEDDESETPPSDSPTTKLDDQIIDYLRQTADWDPKGASASRAHEAKETRADRLLPFEKRARRQYRDSPRKPPRKKR